MKFVQLHFLWAFPDMATSSGGCAPCPSEQQLIDVTNCICGKGQPSTANFPVGAVVGGVVGGVCAIISALVLLVIYYKRSTRVKYPDFGRSFEGNDELWIVPKELRRFRVQELEKATNNFDENCYAGSGGLGKVYRGVLPDGTVVAIKCASQHSAQGQTQFRNELTLLSRLHHRNLVSLKDFATTMILVYEFMENGDLSESLFGKNRKLPQLRANDLELCLELHEDWIISILLRYLDPDYFRTNQLTTASDGYAFGIVVLEIITGYPVIDYTRFNSASLDAWTQQRFNQGGIRAIIDRKMDMDYNENLYTDMVHLALRCAEHDRLLRPTMKEVLTILEPYAKMLLDTPSNHRIEWSTSHFRNKSLFETETPIMFGSPESTDVPPYRYGTETDRLTPGPSTSVTLSPGLSECFTELIPR